MRIIALSGACLGLAACTPETLMALESMNAGLTCMNAHPNNPAAQSDCEEYYYQTGYLPDTSQGPVSASPYGSRNPGGYGGYPSTPSSPPDQPFTVSGSGSASVRSTALQGAYNNASSVCGISGGTLGATEFQDCSEEYDTWYCTVRVWCG